jgi:hypothetical protein
MKMEWMEWVNEVLRMEIKQFITSVEIIFQIDTFTETELQTVKLV